MSISTPQAIDPARIQRLSRMVAIACIVVIFLLPIALLIFWATAEVSTLARLAHLQTAAIQSSVQPWQRTVCALVSGLPLALLMLGLWEARQCFARFARGDFFNTDAVSRLRRFAARTFASGVLATLIGPVLSVVLTFNNPTHQRHLALGISSDQVLLFLFSSMVWLMAAVIGQAKALADENAAFV
jgi:hypothetical protein